MAAILSAEHLSKSYTLKKLLTDVTLYIGEHDRIGVVGVNGTGKSTLLKLLAGLDEPDGGTVMRKNGLRALAPIAPFLDEDMMDALIRTLGDADESEG